jgi:MFS family permease
MVGSLFCIGVGRAIDRRGSRIVLTLLAAALGIVVLTMTWIAGALALLILITLTRGLGQSALSVVSLAMVGRWFRARLTRAMAIYAVVMSIGFMVAFPLVGALVQARGWRVAWAAIGAALLIGLAPIAWLFDRSSPESIGLEVDGAASDGVIAGVSATLMEALRSPAFWVFGLATSVYGLVASGIGLFNKSILAERGFAPEIYYRALAITAITGLLGNFGAGALAGRGSLRHVLVAALLISPERSPRWPMSAPPRRSWVRRWPWGSRAAL